MQAAERYAKLYNHFFNMMFIPFKRFKIISLDSQKEIIERLSSVTDKRIFLRTKNTSKKFEGIVKSDRFEINRILNYRNNFYPVITGKFTYNPLHKSEVQITMRMTLYAIIFMSIWFIITITIFCLALEEQLNNEKIEAEPLLWSSFFVVVGYLLMIFAFNYEANKAKKLLVDLF